MKHSAFTKLGARHSASARRLAARRGWVSLVGAVLVATAWTLAAPVQLAFAQSPSPSVHFLDYRPSTYNTSPTGVVVEALGMGACSYSLSSAESATVKYINAKKPVWTEISPQSGCASLSSYESMINSLISYVKAHSSVYSTWWAGVMLDEEPNFGFSASTVVSLNNYVASKMSAVSGVPWVTAEDATWSGAWSQSQYNSIVAPVTAAPQVYNSYMVGIVNNEPSHYNLVTWTTSMPYPFNSQSYTTGQIHGTPYEQSFGGSLRAWANQWQAQ